jgi:NADH-quinone oxidoreductase subunit N
VSAPLIWIGLPVLMAGGLWFLRRRHGLVILLSVMVGLVLAFLAWILPIGQVITLGSWKLQIVPVFEFAGRRLLINNSDRPVLILLYLICSFWFIGGDAAKAYRVFNSLALLMIALLVAALAVEPFLYAALLVEMAVLVAVPTFAPPGRAFGSGIMRFLIFQTLAMPFILLAGWALAQVEANPTNTLLVTLSTVFLGLGFAFWLAVFPFYTWIPLLSEQSHPYISGFVFLVFLTVNMMLGLNFLERFAWLQSNPAVYPGIRVVGVLMVGTAGAWAIFQKDLARLFGYAVIVETGFSLLAVSLSNLLGAQLFVSMFLPRTIAFGLWALALSILQHKAGSTRFEDVQGLSNRLPFAAAGLAFASLTMAGLPLLAAFPIRQTLMEALAGQSLVWGLAVLVGSVGLLFGTFRGLAALARGTLSPQAVMENRTQVLLLVTASAALLAIGLLPGVFLPIMFPLLSTFPGIP